MLVHCITLSLHSTQTGDSFDVNITSPRNQNQSQSANRNEPRVQSPRSPRRAQAPPPQNTEAIDLTDGDDTLDEILDLPPSATLGPDPYPSPRTPHPHQPPQQSICRSPIRSGRRNQGQNQLPMGCRPNWVNYHRSKSIHTVHTVHRVFIFIVILHWSILSMN